MSSGYTGLICAQHVRLGWFNKVILYNCETYELPKRLTYRWYVRKVFRMESKFKALRLYAKLKKEPQMVPRMLPPNY